MAAPLQLNITNMGFKNSSPAFKRMFRWRFSLAGIIGDFGLWVKTPSRAQRPTISFKEQSYEHLQETISFPLKPDWKPLQVTVYDTYVQCVKNQNPVWNWINTYYQVTENTVSMAYATNKNPNFSLKQTAYLIMYDGKGVPLEQWVFEGAWPQDINFGELAYDDSGISMIDFQLRYDRAYLVTY